MTIRQVKGSPKPQGESEEVAYYVDTTPWGGYGSAEVVKLIDANENDVSLTNLTGAPSVVGNVITTPLVVSLGRGIKYRLEIQWVLTGNTWEAFCDIHGEA